MHSSGIASAPCLVFSWGCAAGGAVGEACGLLRSFVTPTLEGLQYERVQGGRARLQARAHGGHVCQAMRARRKATRMLVARWGLTIRSLAAESDRCTEYIVHACYLGRFARTFILAVNPPGMPATVTPAHLGTQPSGWAWPELTRDCAADGRDESHPHTRYTG